MMPSQLVAIVQRLQTMTEQSSEVEIRRFEKNGVERCVVTYNREINSFELEDLEAGQVFQFDDIDLVAIEIYEILQD